MCACGGFLKGTCHSFMKPDISSILRVCKLSIMSRRNIQELFFPQKFFLSKIFFHTPWYSPSKTFALTGVCSVLGITFGSTVLSLSCKSPIFTYMIVYTYRAPTILYMYVEAGIGVEICMTMDRISIYAKNISMFAPFG